MDQRILIVGGCPRSGTTAVARLLNAHPAVCLGDERYYWRFEQGDLTPDLFVADRFFDLQEADRYWDEDRAPLPEGANRAAFEQATWVGDKYPPLWRAYEAIAGRMPGARILCVVRNPLSVAESYRARALDGDDRWHFGAERALSDWNDAVTGALGAIGRGQDVSVVCYERLFGEGAEPDPLFSRLDLDATPARAAFAEMRERAARLFEKQAPRDEALRFAAAQRCDYGAYHELTAHCLLREA